MKNGTAYFMILEAVRSQPGLIHGQLQDGNAYCAIGSYFHVNEQTCLQETLIDEVAAVNDSMPSLTPKNRKLQMMRWLRWKLDCLGMRVYSHTKKP